MLDQYLNIIVHFCSLGLGKTGGAFLRYRFEKQEKLSINQTIMYKLKFFQFLILVFCVNACFLTGQTKSIKRPPSLPTNIPPPPSFANSSSKNGKFSIISGEYYSQDSKPFLYKRLIKIIPPQEKLGYCIQSWVKTEKSADGFLSKISYCLSFDNLINFINSSLQFGFKA